MKQKVILCVMSVQIAFGEVSGTCSKCVDSPEREVSNGRIMAGVCTLSSSIQLSSSQYSYNIAYGPPQLHFSYLLSQ